MSKSREHSFPMPETGEAEVRDLIRAAGPRPSVPSEELAAIRNAARHEWGQMVGRERERARFRRKSSVWALAASLLLALALGWWLMPDWKSGAPAVVASLDLVRGDARVDGSVATSGSSLVAGTVLETRRGVEASGLAIRLAGGQSVRLDEGTRVRLASDSSFELERGVVYVDTFHAAKDAVVEVSTAYGNVRDIGTQFEVRVDGRLAPEMTVRVREGQISLERGASTHVARAGEVLTLRGDDAVERSSVQVHGAPWAWVEGVTPAMDIEGASLAAYLEWVARETGRTVRYSDEALEEAAESSIRLHGTIEGSTPEESLAILPSTGLGHRVENGWLVIERP